MTTPIGPLDIPAAPDRSLPGVAPSAANPFALDDRGIRPFEGSERLFSAMAKYRAEDVPDAIARNGHLPGDAADLVRDAEMLMSTATGKARQSILDSEALAADDRVAPEGRRRMLAEAADNVERELTAAAATADAHITAASANLTLAALPKLSDGAAMTARADARMQLDHLQGGARVEAMTDLAKSGDDVAALVAGPWGKQALAAGGLKGRDLDNAHCSIVATAVAAARDSSDDTRRAAAQHHKTLSSLRGQRDVLGHMGRITAGEMRTRHGLPDPVR